MKKNLWRFGFFMCVITAIAGINAFFRDISSDPGGAIPNLVIGLVGVAFVILYIQKRFFPRSRSRSFIKSALPSTKKASESSRPQKSIDNPAEKAAIAAMESQLSRMMTESISVRTQTIDPDEDVKPPKGAEISYLDARALKFWNGKSTDYEIPAYYAESAFGRNVGPALGRLLCGKYLSYSSIEKSISQKTIPELKSILIEHDLKTSGKKAELVHRLMDNLSSNEIEALFPFSVYEITPKGEHALEAYSIIFTSERLGTGFPYYRLIKEKESTPTATDIDIILRMLRQDLDNAQKAGNKELYRVKSAETARLLDNLGKPEEALEYYCLSFFLFWYRNAVELRIDSSSAYDYDAKRIDKCGKLCGYSLSRTLEEFQAALRKHNPFGLCTSHNVVAAQKIFRNALSV